MTPSAVALPETLDELNELCRFFEEAEKALAQGRITDLTGIDARVGAVCQRVQKALPEQQELYLPELTVLINLLNGYEQSLRGLYAAAQAEVKK